MRLARVQVGDLVVPTVTYGDKYVGVVVGVGLFEKGSSVRRPRDTMVLWECGKMYHYESEYLKVINGLTSAARQALK